MSRSVETEERREFERLEHDLLDTPEAGPAAIRGSVLRGAGYVVGIGISLISVSLLIRHIGVSDYGKYVTVISLVTVVSTVSDAGLTTIGIREYATRAAGERGRLMSNLIGLRVALSVAGVLGAVVFAAIAGYGATLVLGTAVAGVGILLTVLQGTYAIPLASRLRLGWLSALDLVRQILTTLSIVALIVAGGQLLSFLAVPIPVGLVVLAITVLLIRGSMPLRPRADWPEYKALLRLVLPVAAAVAAGALYFRVTIILMSIIASPLETGYYATAYRVLEVVVLLPGLVVGSAFPVLARAARDDAERLRYALTRLIEAMVIVGVWIGGSIALIAPFAIEVLAGGKSDPSVVVLQVQSVAIAVNFFGAPVVFGLLSLARYRDVLICSLLGIALSATLTLILVPLFQARGGGLAIVGTDITVTALSFWLLRRTGTGVGFPRRVTVRVLGAGALAAVVALVLPVGAVAQTVIGSAVFFLVLYALRGIPAELAQALLPWARRDVAQPPPADAT